MTDPQTLNGWTFRVKAPESEPARLLLMIHGWTGDENSMWVFTRNLPADRWLLAPRAPHIAQQGGFTWRHPKPGVSGWPAFEDFHPSAGTLIQFVDEWASANDVDARQFDAIGFSQGAAMASVLAMLYPQRVNKIGLLSGFMPEGSDAHIGALRGKSVFVAHGTQDQMVSVERARDAVTQLEAAGSKVTYCEAEVEHKVSAECRRALEAFLAQDYKVPHK
jgi:phospholipase/carboxylesterase